MRRREFIMLLGGVAVAWPLAATAQQPARMWRLGYLRAAPPPDRNLQILLRALADKDYVQGQNFVLITQWGDGRVARLPELAVALVNAGVDLIVTELAVIVQENGRLILVETAPGVTVGDVRAATEAELILSADLRSMSL